MQVLLQERILSLLTTREIITHDQNLPGKSPFEHPPTTERTLSTFDFRFDSFDSLLHSAARRAGVASC